MKSGGFGGNGRMNTTTKRKAEEKSKENDEITQNSEKI
jgi:hypothetical protein